MTRLSVAAVAILLMAGCDGDPTPEIDSANAAGEADKAEAASDRQYPPVSVDMELKKVSDHVYYVRGKAGAAFEHEGFISNAAAVVTGDGVLVFDALGTPALAETFVTKLREVTDQPIKRVVLSHYHADHIYGLQVFDDLGAEIWAPAGAREYLKSPQAGERLEERRFSLEPWVDERTHLVAPDRILSEGERFSMGKVDFTLTVVGAAHSDGDLTIYVEPDRVLLSGDVIFEGRVPFLGDANTAHWLEVLEKMESQEVTALIPGHGGAAESPNEAVALTRHYLAYLRETMGEAVENFTPFAEAYGQTDWSEFEGLPAFDAAHRRNAYQVYLSMEAESLGE